MRKLLIVAVSLLLPALAFSSSELVAYGKWFVEPASADSVMSGTKSDLGGILSVSCNTDNQYIGVTVNAPLMNFKEKFGFNAAVIMYRIDGGDAVSIVGLLEAKDLVFMTNSALGADFQTMFRALQSGSTIGVEIPLATQIWAKHDFSLKGSSTAINEILSQCGH